MIKTLVNENLINYIAMDIKNCEEKYNLTIGKQYNFNLTETINYIISCGIDYEFRTSLISGHHTHKDIEKIRQMLKGAKKYYLQKFEDSGNCLSDGLSPIDIDTAKEFCEILKKDIPNTKLRGY
jgi:pyruvate formate lyase activating enzyme